MQIFSPSILAAFVATGLLAAPEVIATSGALAQSAVSHTALDEDSTPFSSPVADLARPESPEDLIYTFVSARLAGDLTALQSFRPGYSFWQHIFTVPDGAVAFGSAETGALLAVFPNRGDWVRSGQWEDPTLTPVLTGRSLPNGMTQRRREVAEILEPVAGPVIHNATRGLFLLPNARRYGSFLEEWGRIYERFGVPAEVGLAQAIVESGLNGTIRSEARAIGFCQWLPANWDRMKRFASSVIEGHNQTTQAAYCAAYLTILATKYGTFIPALSEHHAGGTNVGRTVITGSRLGGLDVREQYFLGSEFARDLREIAPRQFSDVYGTYGPRSFRYAEMVFGNTYNVAHLRDEIPQERIYAMRARRNIPIAEVAQRSGLSTNEVRRYNPALIRQVPAGANVYLPVYVEEFGQDVSFWHRPAEASYALVLSEFLGMDAPPEQWDSRSFEPVLREFRHRFNATGTEEGAVMATVLAYVIDEAYRSRRADILHDYRTSVQIQRLVEQGIQARERFVATNGNIR